MSHIPFKETLLSKEDLDRDFTEFAKRKQELGQNALLAYYGLIHGDAINKFYKNKSQDLMTVGEIPVTSSAYFQAGIRAYENLKNSLVNFPLCTEEDEANDSIKEEYIWFLKNCSGTPGSWKNYSDFARINSTLAKINETDSFDIYDYRSIDAVELLISKISNDEEFIEYNKKGGNQYSNALQHYLRFIKARQHFRSKTAKAAQPKSSPLPLQRIYYGSPGTGKSHEIETKILKGVPEDRIFRTTFHPDSDYSSFVGAYKPVMDGDKIRYEFEPQAFTDAYVTAWKNLAEGNKVFLIIEEINRGNCAQVFGDLFQLLDRKNGVSEYPIKADKSLCKYLEGQLGKDSDGIKDGKLCLPPNLHILATMNTSDQSLFPMDSAFKRRWEWKYVPTTPPKGAEKSMRMEIKEQKTAYGKTVNVGNYTYSWTEFLDKINDRILQATHSEDKQLGFWFVGGDEVREIPVSTFVSKVVFYLWNDVFKDFGAKDSNPFSVNVDGKYSLMSFNKFFEINAEGDTEENLGVLHRFMGNVGLTPEPEYVPQDKEDDILANEGMDQDNGDTIDAQAPEASSADTEPAE